MDLPGNAQRNFCGSHEVFFEHFWLRPSSVQIWAVRSKNTALFYGHVVLGRYDCLDGRSLLKCRHVSLGFPWEALVAAAGCASESWSEGAPGEVREVAVPFRLSPQGLQRGREIIRASRASFLLLLLLLLLLFSLWGGGARARSYSRFAQREARSWEPLVLVSPGGGRGGGWAEAAGGRVGRARGRGGARRLDLPSPSALLAGPLDPAARPRARPRARAGASFLLLQGERQKPGAPLPGYAYTPQMIGSGVGTTSYSSTIATRLTPGTKALVLVASDDDAFDERGEPAGPLWAVANISLKDAEGLSHPKSGRVVVPYHGADPVDDGVHRVFFRAYELDDLVPEDKLASWETLSQWMASSGLTKEALHESQRLSEFLFTAVHRLPEYHPTKYDPATGDYVEVGSVHAHHFYDKDGNLLYE
ncbi:unnamed protein product [Prorocentrum cordatum]|uniref:Uncharacterized protein n=1 Tax=Prorocentrum cordatum TaxID=2364126 RepID=A0ABN9UBT7_9DINO|nr:unnamed protein product [Polarella glacialis]